MVGMGMVLWYSDTECPTQWGILTQVPLGLLLNNTEKMKEIFREEVEEMEHFTEADHKGYSKRIFGIKEGWLLGLVMCEDVQFCGRWWPKSF